MKKFFVNLGLVVSAFVIGLAINNACAQKSDPVDNDQPESSSYFKVVDGLLIGPDGRVCNQIEKRSGMNVLGLFENEEFGGVCTYEYDEYGRLKSLSNVSEYQSDCYTLTLVYDGLTVKQSVTANNYSGESTITYRPL